MREVEKDIHKKMIHDQHNLQERHMAENLLDHLIQILLKDHKIDHEYLQRLYNQEEDK